MREKRRLWTALAYGIATNLVACVIGLGVRPAQASPLDLYGFGGRTSGMSGAGLVTSNDFDSVLLNPAGLASARLKRLSIGNLYGKLTLRIDGEARDVAPANGFVIGGVIPIAFGGPWRDRVTLGIGFYVPTESLAHNKAPFPGQPQFALLEQRSQILSANVSLGVWLNDEWQVGAGLTALATLTGDVNITADELGRFNSTSAQHLVTKAAPIVGVQWSPNSMPAMLVGLGVRGKTSSGYDLNVTTDFGSIVPIELPQMRIAGTPQFEPLSANAEAAWTLPAGSPNNTLKLIAALAWQHWSKYPLPTLNPVAGMPAQPSPDFHDIVVPRAGAEFSRGWRKVRLTSRAGVAFFQSPAPEMTGFQSLLDNHRVMTSAGLGAAIRAGHNTFTIDAWLQAHTLLSRSHRKDPSQLPEGTTPGFDQIDTGGHIYAGGLSVGVSL